MFDVASAWSPNLDWSTPAGQVLRRLLAALPIEKPIIITVFGSAPLQLGMDGSFLSADVDIFSDTDLCEAIAQAGLGKGQSAVYIEQSSEIVFSAAISWRERAFAFHEANHTLLFPHPIDILVSKLKRLEPKDLAAFRLVLENTGHPSPDELKAALQRHIDIFRPNFDEEQGGDALSNARTVWREIYGQIIDVRREIIAPALQARRAAYGASFNSLKNELPD